MMPDREKVIKDNAIRGLQSVIEISGALVHLRKEHAKAILELLKEQEVKTGKWIEKTDYMGDTYYDCSVCNESWITIEGTPWVNGMNYCPHCGAKMEFEGR